MSERPQPGPEHVDAVARVVAGHLGTAENPIEPHGWRCFHPDMYPGYCRCAPDLAEDILTSDDPAVHAALLAALTRAGVLTEEWCLAYESTGDPTMDNPSGIKTQHSVVANRAVAEQAVESRIPGGRHSTIRNRRVEFRAATDWKPPTPAQDGPQDRHDATEAP